MEKNWLDWGREIQGLAQNGMAFTKDPFDRERYVSLKRIAAEMLSDNSSHSTSRIESVFSAEKGYSTPKVDVRAAAFKDGKILLVKERQSRAWTLPGGYVDVNESLSEAGAREAHEESGFVVKPVKIAAVFDHRRHGYKPHLYHFYKVYMICEIVGGNKKTNVETCEVGFFSKSEVSSLNLDPARVTKTHILRMFEHQEIPNLPTDFD